MSKDDVIELSGTVIEILPYQTYKVRIDNGSGMVIIAYPSGKMRIKSIKIIEGDTVKVELSPYDLTKGRIVWRNSN